MKGNFHVSEARMSSGPGQRKIAKRGKFKQPCCDSPACQRIAHESLDRRVRGMSPVAGADPSTSYLDVIPEARGNTILLSTPTRVHFQRSSFNSFSCRGHSMQNTPYSVSWFLWTFGFGRFYKKQPGQAAFTCIALDTTKILFQDAACCVKFVNLNPTKCTS